MQGLLPTKSSTIMIKVLTSEESDSLGTYYRLVLTSSYIPFCDLQIGMGGLDSYQTFQFNSALFVVYSLPCSFPLVFFCHEPGIIINIDCFHEVGDKMRNIPVENMGIYSRYFKSKN